MALALHGNAWLAEPQQPAPALLETNSAFRFVNSLRVLDRSGRWRPREVAFNDTASWFEHLRVQRIDRLTLLDAHATGPVPDEVAATFANGIPWSIGGSTRRERRRWGSSWAVTDADAADRRIWAMRLEIEPSAVTDVVAAPGVNLATAELDHALEDISAFAAAHGLGNWRERFDGARAQLDASEPVLPYHPDIAPAGSLPPARARLLAAAMTAWVFGGMGSWNDIGLDGAQSQGAMARETHRLYQAVMAAFLAVTNAA